MGSLLVISPGFLGTLGLLAVAAWAVWVWRRRRLRWRGHLAMIGAATVLTLLAAADVVNAYYAYLPRVDDVLGVTTWPTLPLAQVGAQVDGAADVPAGARDEPLVTGAAGSPDGPRPGPRPESEPSTGPFAGPSIGPSMGLSTGAPTHRGPAARPRRGAVVTVPLRGRTSRFGTHEGLVYLPPQYFTDVRARFPTVYLLHGSPGAPIDWYRANRAADIAARLADGGRPAILVAPLMSHDWLDDSECVDRPGERVESYLVDDVVPQIDATFRTLARREDRIVAGNSAGGFCALNLGLRHRDAFATIVALSGFSRPTHDGGMVALFGKRPDLAAVIRANDPSRYAASLPPSPTMRVWLDCGRQDVDSLRDETALAPVLRAAGYSVVLQVRGGRHDYGVWRPALRDALAWAVPPASS